MWPMASSPGSCASTGGVKISATWPMALWQWISRPSLDADARAFLAAMLQGVQAQIGQLGCFRDGRKWRTRRTLREIYRTYVFEQPPARERSFSRASLMRSRNSRAVDRVCAAGFRIALLDCNADRHGASTPCFAAIAATRFGFGGRNQNARRAFVEQQNFGPQVAIQFDLRADLVGPKRAFGQRHRQAAVAQIVRRFGQPVGDDLADGVLHALLVLHVERRRQSPQLLRRSPWRTACRRSACRRTSPTPPSSITRAARRS